MFWKIKSFPVLTFMLAALLLLSACANRDSGGRGDFLIGVIPAQGSNQMQKGADKLAEVLSEELGRPVRAEVYPDYNGVVEAMGANKLQMAYLGPLTYVEAHERYNIQAIATQLINGQPYYYSYMIAPADSPHGSMDDVSRNSREIRFAFGDISSTSGSLIPSIALKKAGLFRTPQDHQFRSVTYTGDHLATALSVQNRQLDVGAIDSAYFHHLVREKRIDESKLKIIWQSEQLFQYPWAVVSSISQSDIAKIQAAMEAIEDPEILNAFGGASGFIKANNEDYAAIREAAIEDGRFRPRQ